MPTTFTEGAAAAEFILSEANGSRSRDNITILSGQTIKAGNVLGKVTASGKYKLVTVAASDGSQNGVAVAIYDVDASGGDTYAAAIVRDAEVNKNLLTYGADVDTSPEQLAVQTSLATVGIIAR